MLSRHVALLSQTASVKFDALTTVAAAIQKQVTRDFGPLWGVDATVDAFATLEQIPIDYWHVTIRDDIDRPDANGFHTTEFGQPLALVQFDDDWSITTSHEVLEMLADPSGNALVAGDSPQPGQGRVNFLQEICDPCQTATYAVNGVTVCDFCTPHFYDPVASSAVRYSFTGKITAPRQIIQGGYITFIDPTTRHVFQQQWFDGPRPVIVDLSAAPDAALAATRRPGETLRGMIDRITPRPARRKKRTAAYRESKRQETTSLLAAASHGRSIERQIEAILQGVRTS